MTKLIPHDVNQILKATPAVHELCWGAFLQKPLRFSEAVRVIPLAPLEMVTEAHFLQEYVDLIGGEVDEGAVSKLREQGTNSRPVVSIIVERKIDADADTLESTTEDERDRAKRVLSWIAGESPKSFGFVIACKGQHFFRLLPYRSRQRTQLGLDETGMGQKAAAGRVFEALDKDPYLKLAISLYNESLAEENQEFKIARLFNCLECLAHEHQKGDVGSRQAVRNLIGYAPRVRASGANDKEIEFDPVEIGGRIRDKWFHGARLKKTDLKPPRVYDYLHDRPGGVGESLMIRCEIEILRSAARTLQDPSIAPPFAPIKELEEK